MTTSTSAIKNPLRQLAAACALLVPALSCHAGARAELNAFADGIHGISGDFVQRVYDSEGRVAETSSGTLALKAPNQFKWQYQDPFPQLIVADGQNVWIYDEDLDQVTVKPQSLEEAQSPLTVITNLDLLEDEYFVDEQRAHDGLLWLRLTPKNEDASFEYCELGFRAGTLSQMVLKDHLAQRNVLTFGPWKRNPRFGTADFRFVPPTGVEVVGQPAKSADAYPVQE